MSTLDDIMGAVADIIDPSASPDPRIRLKEVWLPEPHQVPPRGKWFGWILFGGRGTGKTDAAAHYFYDHCMGPPCDPNLPGGHWPSIIAPTLGDGVTSCVNGPSGLRSIDPRIKVRVTPGGTIAIFPNGVEAKIFGAFGPEDVERLRSGGNRCVAWLEEFAAWKYLEDCFKHMRFGLRLGPRPHWISSTTPKSRPLIKKLYKQALAGQDELGQAIVMTHGTTDDNPHLEQHIRDMLYADYGGTRLGRQELSGELLDDIENALFHEENIARYRLRASYAPQHYDRIVIGVDPEGGGENGCTGIVGVGLVRHWESPQNLAQYPYSALPQAFVLADNSLHGHPAVWARKVIETYDLLGANYVIAEKNNGYEMVKHTLHTERSTLPVDDVWASLGKTKRAEPIGTLAEQGRLHMVGDFPLLEDQMCSWDPVDEDPDWSPDRMDAMVWAVSKLIPNQSVTIRNGMKDSRLAGRR